MQPRIAVAFVHGIEIDDPDFAATPTRLLKEAFAAAVGPGGPDPDEALVIEPVAWAPFLERRQRQLFARVYPDNRGSRIVDWLMDGIRRVNAGAYVPLVPLTGALLAPVLPGLRDLRYPGLRWVGVHFLGDAIAYDRGASPSTYIACHVAMASALARLAERAGPTAPLAVVAHSFGSLLTSDYVYDQQSGGLVPPEVAQVAGASPLARAQTLSWLFTLGSPLALWSLRYPDGEFDRPITLPGHPRLGGPGGARWENLYARSDVIAYPLRGLGPQYAAAVTQDVVVRPAPFPVGGTPAVHPYYWADRRVMRRLGATLAAGWHRLTVVDPAAASGGR